MLRKRMSFQFLSVCLFSFWLTAPQAGAEVVLVRSGEFLGQGLAFSVQDKGCFIVSVAHTLKGGKSPITVHGKDGTIFEAEIVKLDQNLDLVLLDIGIDGERIKYTYNEPDSCKNHSQYRLEKFALQKDVPTFSWMDRVASPAGGHSRAMLGDVASIQNGLINISVTNPNADISQGDSGAPVSVLRYNFPKYTHEKNRETVTSTIFEDSPENLTPKPRGKGFFIGLIKEYNNGRLSVIPAGTVLDFALDGLAGAETSVESIEVQSQYGEVVAAFRGSAKQQSIYNSSMSVSVFFTNIEYYAYSWVIDLGPRDRIIRKIDLVYDENPTDLDRVKIGTSFYELPIGVYTSNKDYGSVPTLNDMDLSRGNMMLMNQVYCLPPTDSKMSRMGSFRNNVQEGDDEFILECEFVDKKIARTMAITAFAHPGTLKKVKIYYVE